MWPAECDTGLLPSIVKRVASPGTERVFRRIAIRLCGLDDAASESRADSESVWLLPVFLLTVSHGVAWALNSASSCLRANDSSLFATTQILAR